MEPFNLVQHLSSLMLLIMQTIPCGLELVIKRHQRKNEGQEQMREYCSPER